MKKNIVLGVTGGIAAYKACDIVSRLKKLGAGIDVIMTEHAQEFVRPLTFENLAGTRVITDMFDRDFEYHTEHISLAKKADAFVIAPATANVIAKIANGIADDMLTTTFLAAKDAVKIICPAMNTNMLDDPQTQANIETLKNRGIVIIDSVSGRLACGDTGKGKMAEPADIVAEIERLLQPRQDLKGKRVLVTAGATEENIDGVRFITNRSSGKMGVAIANAAAERGAEVFLVAGRMSVDIPAAASETKRAYTTNDMLESVMGFLPKSDIIIMAAAPADYKLEKAFDSKLKAEKITLEFSKNPDIAAAVGKVKGDKKLIIFSAETDNLEANAIKKLKAKNADMAVANDVTKEGAGFDVDTNIVTIYSRSGGRFEYPKMKKTEVADIILDRAVEL